MNVTLSVDSEVLARARRFAERNGTTLNQLVRDYLAELTAGADSGAALAELEHLWRTAPGGSEGRTWSREEIHDRAHVP